MRRFRVERQLGRGGYGRVLLARELGPAVVTPVAIKLAQGMWRPCPDDARRARDEARLLASLDHPAIVRLQSLIQTEHGPALILEYVPGFTLHQILRVHDRLPVVPALELVAEVADALEAGWSQVGPLGQALRLLHRDIKPGNLMITPRGAVKVLDFGIARAATLAREVQSGPVPVGTTDYMAPERSQRAGQALADTPAGDLFSLGLVLFGALTGAFHGGLPYEPEGWALFRQDVEAELTEALAEQPLGEAVAKLVLDLLEVDPALRPDPACTRDRALALARELGGEGLRAWAVRAVAGMPAPRPEALSGYAWEGVEIAETSGEKAEMVEPPAPAEQPHGAGARGARVSARRRRPLRAAPVVLPPAQPEAVEVAPPVDPALLEPVPMSDPGPDPDPPRRVGRSRGWWVALSVVALLGVLLSLRGPKPAPAGVEPVNAVAVASVLDQAAPPAPPAPVVESEPEPVAAAATAGVGLLHRRVKVGLSGEAQRAALLTPRGEIPLPAEVRPGTYTLRVTFPGEDPIDFPGVTLSAGQRWEIRCSAAVLQCRASTVE